MSFILLLTVHEYLLSGGGRTIHTAFNFLTCIRRSGEADPWEGGASSSSDEISMTSDGSSFSFRFGFLFVVGPKLRLAGLCGGDEGESGASEEGNSRTSSGGVFPRFEGGFVVRGDTLERPLEVVEGVFARGIWLLLGCREMAAIIRTTQ